MPSNDHKNTARQVFEDVFNGGQYDLARELFTDDFLAHAFPDERGPDGIETIITGFRQSFPDIEWTIETLFGEGEYVAVRWTAQGTHDGEYRGTAPTGRRVEIPGNTILRFEAGQVAEGWTIFDETALLEQIGGL